MHTLGTHFLVELAGCSHDQLNNQQFVEDVLLAAAQAAKATVVTSKFHSFSPFGVSGVVVIAESHITIHTWPEYGYAAIDVFTCGGEAMPRLAVDECIHRFKPATHTFVEVKRGIMDDRAQKATCFLSFEELRSGAT